MRILLFGGNGLLGSELRRQFDREAVDYAAPPHSEVDCRNAGQVRTALRSHRPSAVVVAAARVGGILANLRHGSEFLFDNTLINLVTLQACVEEKIGRVLLFGSSCMYPTGMDRPIREEDLMTGPVEESSEGYAMAKLISVKYAELLRRERRCLTTVCIPTNLYGDEDRFDPEEGHLIASLIPKIHQAKEEHRDEVRLWGDGTPRRDFLHASDAARACGVVLGAADPPIFINIGSGSDQSVREISEAAAEVIGFSGRILFTGEVGNGTSRKLLNVERIRALGWRPEVSLREGLRRAYQSYLTHLEAVR